MYGMDGYSDSGTVTLVRGTSYLHTNLSILARRRRMQMSRGLVRLSAWQEMIYSYVPIRDVDSTVLS